MRDKNLEVRDFLLSKSTPGCTHTRHAHTHTYTETQRHSNITPKSQKERTMATQDFYEIELIQVNRQRKDGCFFKVHYVGYGAEEDRWIKWDDLDAETRHQYFKNGKLKSKYKKRKARQVMSGIKRKAKKPKHIPVRIGDDYQAKIPPRTPSPVETVTPVESVTPVENVTEVPKNLVAEAAPPVISSAQPQTVDLNFFQNMELMKKYSQEISAALLKINKDTEAKIKEEKERHALKKAEEEKKHEAELKYLSYMRIQRSALTQNNIFQKFVNIHNRLPSNHNRVMQVSELARPVGRACAVNTTQQPVAL